MEESEVVRLTSEVCGYAQTKSRCGRVLYSLTTSLDTSAAAALIHDIITRDFFLDLEGNMKSFYREIQNEDLREFVVALLSESHNTNDNGDIVESDEDCNGNLRYAYMIHLLSFVFV
jgi:hypothetical protein